jgi:hypothetical protein
MLGRAAGQRGGRDIIVRLIAGIITAALVGGISSSEAASHQTILHPLPGAVVTQPYAAYGWVVEGQYHTGVDLDGGDTPPVYAAADGVVTEALSSCIPGDTGCGQGFGNHVILQHTLADGRTRCEVTAPMDDTLSDCERCYARGDVFVGPGGIELMRQCGASLSYLP